MAVYTWIGNGSVGNLTDPANWTVNGNANGTAPSGTDDVIIPENTTLSLSYPTGNTLDLTYQSLTIQTGATITFPTYGTVTIDALVTNKGTLNGVNGNETIEFKQSVSGSGTLNVANNATIVLDDNSSFGDLEISSAGNLKTSKGLNTTTMSVFGGSNTWRVRRTLWFWAFFCDSISCVMTGGVAHDAAWFL